MKRPPDQIEHGTQRSQRNQQPIGRQKNPMPDQARVIAAQGSGYRQNNAEQIPQNKDGNAGPPNPFAERIRGPRSH